MIIQLEQKGLAELREACIIISGKSWLFWSLAGL